MDSDQSFSVDMKTLTVAAFNHLNQLVKLRDQHLKMSSSPACWTSAFPKKDRQKAGAHTERCCQAFKPEPQELITPVHKSSQYKYCWQFVKSLNGVGLKHLSDLLVVHKTQQSSEICSRQSAGRTFPERSCLKLLCITQTEPSSC